jgi:hypothetical protein
LWVLPKRAKLSFTEVDQASASASEAGSVDSAVTVAVLIVASTTSIASTEASVELESATAASAPCIELMLVPSTAAVGFTVVGEAFTVVGEVAEVGKTSYADADRLG